MGTGDVSFRIYWSPATHDIDLHVADPNGHTIWYGQKTCPCHGELDRDDQTSGGPENIYWPVGKGPKGVYAYYVHYFAGSGVKRVKIELRKAGKLILTKTVLLQKQKDESEHFTYDPDVPVPPAVWQPTDSEP